MKREMTARQRRAWSFAAATVPAVMVCAGKPWPWVLAGSGAAAVYYLILYTLRCTSAVSMTESYPAALGQGLGRTLLTLTGIWSLLALSNAASGAAAAFPEDEAGKLAPAVLLALTAWACRKDAGAPVRCAAVAAPILAGLYLVLIAAAAPEIKTAWLRPWGKPDAMLETGGAMLLPTAALFLAGKPEKEKSPAGVLGVMLLAPAAMAAVTAGNLSPEVTQAERMPFYTLTKTLSLLNVMERLEPVLSAALYLGLFCMASLLTESCAECLCAAVGPGKKSWMSWAVCAAAFALCGPVCRLDEWIWSLGSAVCWGMVPILVQVVVGIKKDEKKVKKS